MDKKWEKYVQWLNCSVTIKKKTLFSTLMKRYLESSLVVQWLRLHAPNAEGPGSIPGQEINRGHMPQARIHMSQPRPSAVK